MFWGILLVNLGCVSGCIGGVEVSGIVLVRSVLWIIWTRAVRRTMLTAQPLDEVLLV